jgi:hypothetical protein
LSLRALVGAAAFHATARDEGDAESPTTMVFVRRLSESDAEVGPLSTVAAQLVRCALKRDLWAGTLQQRLRPVNLPNDIGRLGRFCAMCLAALDT